MRPARRLARLAVMPPTGTTPQWIARLLREQSGVLTQAAASAWLGRAALRWRLETARWQRPCHGVVVTHSGPLTPAQRQWAAVLACGRGAALAGLTAARLDGLSGFPDERIHLLIPATAWWADMRRDNEFTASGWRVLRFPAFVQREHPELVAAQVMAALALAPAG